MYKIDFAKQLDTGTSNVEIEGKVTYAKDPINWKSAPSDKRQYDFWIQWLYLQDDTGSIGVSISIGKEEDKITQGDMIKVKGKIEEWQDRNGAVQKKLVGRLVEPSEEKKEKIIEELKKEEPVGVTNISNELKEGRGIRLTAEEREEAKKREEIALRRINLKAIEIASNLVVAKQVLLTDMFSFVDKIVSRIYGKIEEEDVSTEKEEEKIILKKKERDKEQERPPQRKKEQEVKESKKLTNEKKKELDEYLMPIFIKAKEVDLEDWKNIIYFAVKSDVFNPGINIEEAKERLFQHKELYDALLEAIQAKKEILENIPSDDELTEDIPF